MTETNGPRGMDQTSRRLMRLVIWLALVWLNASLTSALTIGRMASSLGISAGVIRTVSIGDAGGAWQMTMTLCELGLVAGAWVALLGCLRGLVIDAFGLSSDLKTPEKPWLRAFGCIAAAFILQLFEVGVEMLVYHRH